MPDKNIPELQFVTEKNWADAVWDADLNTEDGVREALSKLRDKAQDTFLNLMRSAIQKYMAANNGVLPADLSELKPYFQVPVSDAMLQRYKLLQTGKLDNSHDVVKLATYADAEYDSNHGISMDGGWGSRFNRLEEAINSAAKYFTADNNGAMPSDPSQIAPYLKKPVEAATVQKYLNKIAIEASK